MSCRISAICARRFPFNTAFAKEGGGAGPGGGNATAIEFKMEGFQVIETLKVAGQHMIGAVNLDQLGAKLGLVTIKTTTSALSLNDDPKDAINEPVKNLVTLYKPSWEKMKESTKQQLVIHEMLRFLGIDDHDYRNSTSVIQAYRVAQPAKPIVRQLRSDENKCLNIENIPASTDCLVKVLDHADKVLAKAVVHVEKAVLPQALPERYRPGAANLQVAEFKKFRDADAYLSVALLAGTIVENAQQDAQTRLERTIEEIETMTWLE